MKTAGYIVILLMSLTTLSCQHKELCYDHLHNGGLKVVFDWSKASKPIGQNMELYLFPVNGGYPLNYQFYDTEGGMISVPSGVYRAICVNVGTGANRFFDDSGSYDGFTVTTRTVSKVEDSILEPDILYSDHSLFDIDVNDRMEQTLVMHPVQRTPRYNVIVRNIRHLGGVRSCMASLSSLSCGYMAVSDEPSDASHIQNFDMTRIGETTLEGQITIFGHKHSECRNHILTLHFFLLDGNEFICTADISGRMIQLSQEGSMSGDIIVDMDADIPKPISNGSGFETTVGEWKGEEIDLSM
ncbi:MAG: DUF5119 domain-containing protein [Alistipes sp.]|nr:DUF5119 domain-containing protein [Candidatus Minthomonas equi]